MQRKAKRPTGTFFVATELSGFDPGDSTTSYVSFYMQLASDLH